jgi:hypothetical protein
VHDSDVDRAPDTRPAGVLTGLTSAGGGLAIGPDTPVGIALILASPLTTVVIEYATVQTRATLDRWEKRRPIRAFRRTLKKAMKASDATPEEKTFYKAKLALLRNEEIEAQLEAALEAMRK